MQLSSDNAVRVLNALIPVGRDAERGYQLAAVDAREPELARIFAEYAAQRTKFVLELQQRVRTLRETPEEEGTPGGAMHRAWMDLQAALATNERHAILAEVERGEDMAVKAYIGALQERDLDEQTQRLIQRQYEAVQAAHDRIRQLRDRAAPLRR